MPFLEQQQQQQWQCLEHAALLVQRQPKGKKSQGRRDEMGVDACDVLRLLHAVIVVFHCPPQVQRSQAGAEL